VGGRGGAETVRKRQLLWGSRTARLGGVFAQARRLSPIGNFRRKHPAQGKSVDSRRGCADHGRGSRHCPKVKQLGKALGRSVQAIQQMRWALVPVAVLMGSCDLP
jgi:hypothetical protein